MIRRGRIITAIKRFDLRNEQDSNWMDKIRDEKKKKKLSLKEVVELYKKETKKNDKPNMYSLLTWYDKYLNSKKKIASEDGWAQAPNAKDKERKETGKDNDGNSIYQYRDKGGVKQESSSPKKQPETSPNTLKLKEKLESISKNISNDIIDKIHSKTQDKIEISDKTDVQVKNILGNIKLLDSIKNRTQKILKTKDNVSKYVEVNHEDLSASIISSLHRIQDKVQPNTPPKFLVYEILSADEHLSKMSEIPDLYSDIKDVVSKVVYEHFGTDKSETKRPPKVKSYEKSGYSTDITERLNKSFRKKVDSFVQKEIKNTVLKEDNAEPYVKDLYTKVFIRGNIDIAYNEKSVNEKELSKVESLIDGFAATEGNRMEKGARISKILQAIENEETKDWRQKTHGTEDTNKDVSPEEKVAFMEYMKKEQEILVSTGLVDEEGYVTVYRTSGNVKGKVNEEIETDGNYVDSWTMLPDLKWTGDSVIKARVPLNQVVSTCIGRSYILFEGDDPITSWPNAKGEGEIMVSSKYIKAEIVSDAGNPDKETIINAEKKKYYEAVKDRVLGKEKMKTVSEIESHIREELNSLEDEKNPTHEQLIDFKKELGDRAKDLSMDELLILYKTLLKNR